MSFNSKYRSSRIEEMLDLINSGFAEVATSGSYADLLDAPTSLSQFTDDIINEYYLKLSGGTITGNLVVNGFIQATGNINASGNGYYEGNLTTEKVLSFGTYGVNLGSSDPRSSFRESIFETTSNNSYLRTFRNTAEVSNFTSAYASGIAWSSSDSHAYISISPYTSSKTVFVGGGDAGVIDWTAKLFHSGMSIIPDSSSTYNVGSSSKVWNSVYANNIIVGGYTLTTSGSNLSFGGNIIATRTWVSDQLDQLGGGSVSGDYINKYGDYVYGPLVLQYANISGLSNSGYEVPILELTDDYTIVGSVVKISLDGLVGIGKTPAMTLDVFSDSFGALRLQRGKGVSYGVAMQFANSTNHLGALGWNKENDFFISNASTSASTNPIMRGSQTALTIYPHVTASGGITQGSDVRFKNIIKKEKLNINDIANAPLFTFTWNNRESNKQYLGSSAQYWQKILPCIVSGTDFLAMDYATLGVGIGISLANEILYLKEEIKSLKSIIDTLNK